MGSFSCLQILNVSVYSNFAHPWCKELHPGNKSLNQNSLPQPAFIGQKSHVSHLQSDLN